MGTAFKIIGFIIKNWSLLKSLKPLLDEIIKLFKGESSKEAVQQCVDGVCKVAEQKANQPKKKSWLSRWRRR